MSACGDVAALLLLMAVCLSGSSEALMEMKDIECYSNVSLPCEAGRVGPKFRSLTWYKLQNRTGILRSRADNTTLYSYHRQVALGGEGQLILPRVTPNDSGIYECLLRANLGGHNLESSVSLSVNACIEPLTVTPIRRDWTVQKSPLLDVLEVHAGWAALGFISLSLLKIILCVVVIKRLTVSPSVSSAGVGQNETFPELPSGKQEVSEVTEMKPITSTTGPIHNKTNTSTTKTIHTNTRTSTTRPIHTNTRTNTTRPIHTNTRTSTTRPIHTNTRTNTTRPIHTNTRTSTTRPIHTNTRTSTTRPIHTNTRTSTTRPIHTNTRTNTTRPIHTNTRTSTTRPIHTSNRGHKCHSDEAQYQQTQM
ncbi:uncharacterized threonine-rich GPI-anchored glycoprotein PJ4664.02 isoform X3 [Alosa sapidissima]|uniref:uncharacterized threonine-rich GPI-anchored glycoprotein PJ4664.02 isoform X3 n=1 Tax=Alosa sapidissima TaxID=34773 RepID=UPI001C098D39|nr:uncharacterized threonine-rich GPI-anchored glycoprotein PJ4664.02 isoform X3 [Alosa sapidissima]